LESLTKALKSFRPQEMGQAIKMYTILLSCTDFDFTNNGYPGTLEDLLIIWKKDQSFFSDHHFCRSLISCLAMDLHDLVNSYFPRQDDDYCVLLYHLQKRGLLSPFHNQEIVKRVFELIGYGFGLSRLAVSSQGLSERRLMEIFLVAEDPINKKEQVLLEKILACPSIIEEKTLLSRPLFCSKPNDVEKTPPPYDLLEKQGQDFLTEHA
jgi:hypothetical protein